MCKDNEKTKKFGTQTKSELLEQGFSEKEIDHLLNLYEQIEEFKAMPIKKQIEMLVAFDEFKKGKKDKE